MFEHLILCEVDVGLIIVNCSSKLSFCWFFHVLITIYFCTVDVVESTLKA